MKATIHIKNRNLLVDLNKGIDLSIPIQTGEEHTKAWYIDHPKIDAVRIGNWVGSVSEGSAVNFNNIHFNPHAHGTHTECIGHITAEPISINQCLKTFFFQAALISITPEIKEEDRVISLKEVQERQAFIQGNNALIIRTIPNLETKKHNDYDNSNWAYIEATAMEYLVKLGIEHILIDTPSVDKEKDEGLLKAHKAFWGFPSMKRKHCTITEFIFVPNHIEDGEYILNLQVAAFENDASPSRPVLYQEIKP